MFSHNSRAIFLDRDGVLNKVFVKDGKPYSPPSFNFLEILPGVEQALERFKASGFLLIIVTNQPDVSRGKISLEEVEEMNHYLKKSLSIDEVITCYHDDKDECECRKPRAGMLLEAAERYDLNLSECYMVGDRWKDIEAGINAGCKTVFIDYGYIDKEPESYDYKVASLFEAAEKIL